jgi:hypothetical protein
LHVIHQRRPGAFQHFEHHIVLHVGDNKSLSRLYQGSVKALVRLYQGSIKVLLRLY